MINPCFVIAFFTFSLQKIFAQTCLQDINTTHCLICGNGLYAPTSQLIVPKSSCVNKVITTYIKTILIVVPGDENIYSNITFTQKTNNFTDSLLFEEIETRRYINPKLTYMFTFGNHLINSNKPLVLFAGIPDLTFTLTSMACSGLLKCDPSWFSTLSINTANFHFFSSKQFELKFLQIIGSDGSTCTGIGCQPTILAENLFSDTLIIFNSVIFSVFELEYQLEAPNSIVLIGKSVSNFTFTNVRIENCKFDSFVYQYQSQMKNLLSEYLSIYYSTSIIVNTLITNSTLILGDTLNVVNHNRNIGTSSNLINISRKFITQRFGFFYLQENINSFSLSNYNLTNFLSLSNLHPLINLEYSLTVNILNLNVLGNSETGILYCMKCQTVNIESIFIENSTINNFALIMNSSLEIKITKVNISIAEDKGITIQIKDSMKVNVTSLSLINTINPQIDVSGLNTELLLTDFNSSQALYSKIVPTLKLVNCNLVLKDIKLINTDSRMNNSNLIYIQDPTKLNIENIHIENTNYLEIFNIASPNVAVILDYLFIFNVTSMLDVSYIVETFSSKILDFTLSNSILSNHSKISLYSSNNFASKKISLENVTISDSNITFRPALLMWHLSATTKMINCTFENILGKDVNKDLDLIFYFGFSYVEIFNTTFKDLGFFSWRDYYLYGGAEFSFFSFYSPSVIRFIGCYFSIEDTKLNQPFISTILTSNLIEISNSIFISNKRLSASPEYRSAYGLNLNSPALINLTNNTFENLFCYKFPGWDAQYIPNYAPICVFFSSNTEIIVKDKTAIFSNNNFTNCECNNHGGTLSVLNYENVTISNNIFINSAAPKGAFLYAKAIQNLVIKGNKFEDGSSNDAFVTIYSVINAEVSLNQFFDSNFKINSQNSILTLGVENLIIKDSSFYQSRFLNQSKSAIVVDTSKFVSFFNLKVNGSATSNFQATAMYIARCVKFELNNSLITFTENAKFYSVHSDNNQNVVIYNTSFENNYKRLFGFNDFDTIYIDSLIITKNLERSSGESIMYFESQSNGKVDLKNIRVFTNSYLEITLLDILANSEFVVDNLTLNNFQGRLLYAYLYISVPVSIINSKFLNVEFPNSMIFGVYLNLVLINLEINQMNFTSNSIILRSSTFNYKNITLINVRGSDQSVTSCFFEMTESTGSVHFQLSDSIQFENLICLQQGTNCIIENLNVINNPEKSKYKFLLSERSILTVKNSKFLNFTENIFDLDSSSMIFDNVTFDSQQLTISPLANLKKSPLVIISNSNFNVSNLFLFYFYSTEYFKIENSNFNGNNNSFSILVIQYCTLFNFTSSNISKYTYLSKENFSMNAMMYILDATTLYIDNLKFTNNHITGVPILYQRDSQNLTIINTNFQSNILVKKDGRGGVSCIKIECKVGICLNHSIINSKFKNNSAAGSFPDFITDHLIYLNSVDFDENIGISDFLPSFRLTSDNIGLKLNQENVISSGLENTLEILIIDNYFNKTESFDSYSSALIQNLDEKVSIKKNNFVSLAIMGKLIFKGLTINALPKTNIKLKLLVSIKSSKFYDSQSQKVLNIEKIMSFYVRECVYGEIFQSSDSSCSICPLGTFSIYDSNGLLPEFCQLCPDTAVCELNSTIVPIKGYWKANGNSTLVLECPFHDSCSISNESECLLGYEGPLCQYCSIGFGKSLSTIKCIDCSDNAEINMVLTFIYLFLFSLFAIVSTSLAIRSHESASDSIQCLINIVISHYQFLAIISKGLNKLIDIEVTFNVSDEIQILWEIINPNLCFLSFMDDYEESNQVIIMMVIAYVTFFVLLGIAITMYFTFRFTFNRIKKINLFKGSKLRFIMIISLFIFNFFYPSFLSINISKLPCLLIDNYSQQMVMKNTPKIECFGNFHLFILGTMTIPGILVFGFLYPFCLYFLLSKQKDYEVSQKIILKSNQSGSSFKTKIINKSSDNALENANNDDQSQIKPRKTRDSIFKEFGNYLDNHLKISEFLNYMVKNRIFIFFTNDYKKECCYWEVGKLFMKFLIAILSNLETVIHMNYIRLLLFLIFFGYSMILVSKSPFKYHFCNKLELFSSSLCASYLVFTTINLQGIEFTVFRNCQVAGNIFFLLLFTQSFIIQVLKFAKEEYTTLSKSLSKSLQKWKSKRKVKTEVIKKRSAQKFINPLSIINEI